MISCSLRHNCSQLSGCVPHASWCVEGRQLSPVPLNWAFWVRIQVFVWEISFFCLGNSWSSVGLSLHWRRLSCDGFSSWIRSHFFCWRPLWRLFFVVWVWAFLQLWWNITITTSISYYIANLLQLVLIYIICFEFQLLLLLYGVIL